MANEPNVTGSPLSALKNGENGIIIKVKGYGAFRKRINEMGFVPGVIVKAIKRAPLYDPIEYEIMGYRVSLRKSEADLIEVIAGEDSVITEKPFSGTVTCDTPIKKEITEKIKTINVALVGNPNSGKTSLFNRAAHKNEKVGNYGGVTVDISTARFTHNGYTINITDLPGTYSISEYTPEELFVRKHLTENMPDVVVNVIDASNLERNLYLTTQLIDMNIKVVAALNMYDEFEKKGDKFDHKLLGQMIGIPFVPVTAIKGKGINELLDKVIDIYEEKESDYRHIHINYGNVVNDAINNIRDEIKKNQELNDKFHAHFIAVKLLENDREFTDRISKINGTQDVIDCAQKQIKKIEREYNENSTAVITDAKYAFIRGALKETYQVAEKRKINKTYGIDRVLTHKWLGLPVFLLFMFIIFQVTFTLGAYPMEWIELGFEYLGKGIENVMSEGILRDLLIDGIIGGVGSVIVFFPQIIILFIFISFMEDSGYMARVAFLMDKLMHKIGLHGKSVIPILIGFGCNVPAIMATRTLENRKDRILTMLIVPFISCSTKLPIYILLVSALFVSYHGLIVFSIYLIGMLLGLLTAILVKRRFKRKNDIPFVMELPPYRIPTTRNTLRHMWGKSEQYLKKMGGVILIGSIIIWALSYFPQDVDYSKDYNAAIEYIENAVNYTDEVKEKEIKLIEIEQNAEHMGKSYIGRLGHFVEPVIRPLGYDWKIGVGLISGLAAKEFVISTMGILYQSTDDGEDDEEHINLISKLQQQEFTSGDKAGQKVFTPVTAYSLMLFILIYFPCVAVIAAIKKEAGWKWALFSVFYSSILAWIVAYIATLIGNLF